MRKSSKGWLIAAAVLVVIGLIMFVAVMTANHWELSNLSTEENITTVCDVTDSFDSISLTADPADVFLTPSDDGKCRVIFFGREDMTHSAQVQNGTLVINAVDERAWNERIGFNFKSPSVTVYLPEAEYESVTAGTSTGEIRIELISADSFDLCVTTGEITVTDVTCQGDVNANVTTGDVSMINVACRNLLSDGSTGDVSLKNVIAAERLSVERSTGGVIFDRSDAADIFVRTSTGDVTGTLLTEKVFTAESSTGSVNVPAATAGGGCEITTSTGDIDIAIANE